MENIAVSTMVVVGDDVGMEVNKDGLVDNIGNNTADDDGIIRHLIARVECTTGVVVVSQDWSCWVSTLLALQIRDVQVFAPVVYQRWFEGAEELDWRWRSVKEFSESRWSTVWDNYTVLSSGSMQFLPQVMSKLKTHVGSFVYATDVVFAGRRVRDIQRSYCTMQQQRLVDYGLESVQVLHAEFGGITSAIHLLSYRMLTPDVFRPYNVLQRSLAHVLDAATSISGVEIGEPPLLTPPFPRIPIVENDVLRLEGLLDVSRPNLQVVCRSVFKGSGWIRRLPSGIEYLRALDMPVGMDAVLGKEKGMRSKLFRSMSPLIVSSILRAMWSVGGGVTREYGKVQLCNRETDLPQNA